MYIKICRSVDIFMHLNGKSLMSLLFTCCNINCNTVIAFPFWKSLCWSPLDFLLQVLKIMMSEIVPHICPQYRKNPFLQANDTTGEFNF